MPMNGILNGIKTARDVGVSSPEQESDMKRVKTCHAQAANISAKQIEKLSQVVERALKNVASKSSDASFNRPAVQSAISKLETLGKVLQKAAQASSGLESVLAETLQ